MFLAPAVLLLLVLAPPFFTPRVANAAAMLPDCSPGGRGAREHGDLMCRLLRLDLNCEHCGQARMPVRFGKRGHLAPAPAPAPASASSSEDYVARVARVARPFVRPSSAFRNPSRPLTFMLSTLR